MPPRARAEATSEEIADAIRPFVVRRSWLRYDETEKCEKAQVKVDLIAQQHDLLAALHQLAPSMSFVRSKIKTALEIIIEEKAGSSQDWAKLSGEARTSWVALMTNRFMNITHVVKANSAKKTRPKWVGNLPWFADKDEGAEGRETASGPTSAENARAEGVDAASMDGERLEDTERGTGGAGLSPEENAKDAPDQAPDRSSLDPGVGFSYEMGLGWMLKNKKKMYSCPLELPLFAEDTEFVEASWPDGHKTRIPITVLGLREFLEERASRSSSAPPVWEGWHNATKNRVWIPGGNHKDGRLMLMEQGKQIQQVMISMFSGDAEEQLKTATKVLTQVGKYYCDESIKKTEIRDCRNAQLQQLGVQKKKKAGGTKAETGATAETAGETATPVARKRPAAAEAAPATKKVQTEKPDKHGKPVEKTAGQAEQKEGSQSSNEPSADLSENDSSNASHLWEGDKVGEDEVLSASSTTNRIEAGFDVIPPPPQSWMEEAMAYRGQ